MNQLRQAAERRKLRLEEAAARAEEFVLKARKLNEELAAKPGGENYRALCQQLLHMGTDLQAMVERLRASYESPIFKDQQLKSDSEHAIAMDNLLAAIIRALREAERMAQPVEVLATR